MTKKEMQAACADCAQRCDMMMQALKGQGFTQAEALTLVAAMLSSPTVSVPIMGAMAHPDASNLH